MKFFFAYLFSVILFNASSQGQHTISIGPDVGIPTKSFGKSKIGWGGSIQYQFRLHPSFGIQLHAGYSSFTSQFFPDDKVSFLPIRLGANYFFLERFLFVYADAGISRYHSPTNGHTQNDFSFGAGIGSQYEVLRNQIIQLSFYYNLHKFSREAPAQGFNYNWYNFRVAYGFTWGRQPK